MKDLIHVSGQNQAKLRFYVSRDWPNSWSSLCFLFSYCPWTIFKSFWIFLGVEKGLFIHILFVRWKNLFPTQLHFWSLLLQPLYWTLLQLSGKQLLSPQRQITAEAKSWSVQERKRVIGKIWLQLFDSPPALATEAACIKSNPRAALTYPRWQWS